MFPNWACRQGWVTRMGIGENKILDHTDIQGNRPFGDAAALPHFVFARWQKFYLLTQFPFPENPENVINDPKIFVTAKVVADNLPGRLGVCGRWVADCITEGCAGAEDIDTSNLIFMCCHCFNIDHGRKWIRVKMPKNLKAIEAVLLKRPPLNRWWNCETLKAMKQENSDNGFGV